MVGIVINVSVSNVIVGLCYSNLCGRMKGRFVVGMMVRFLFICLCIRMVMGKVISSVGMNVVGIVLINMVFCFIGVCLWKMSYVKNRLKVMLMMVLIVILFVSNCVSGIGLVVFWFGWM